MDISQVLDSFSFICSDNYRNLYKLKLTESSILVCREKGDEKKAKSLKFTDIIGVKISDVSECESVGKSATQTAAITDNTQAISTENSATGCSTEMGDDDEVLGKTIANDKRRANGAIRNRSTGKAGLTLEVHALAAEKGLLSSKSCRKRTYLAVRLSEKVPGEMHRKVLVYLQQQIERRINTIPGYPQRFSKPLLIIVNPLSGKGVAKQQLYENVLPVLDDAGVKYEIIETVRVGHGKELGIGLDTASYYGVVLMSGDGLLYEVLQGLMSRDDYKQAMNIPIGILPGGSGNGLCCSINYAAGEPFQSEMLIHSLYVLLKHRIRLMDLTQVDTVAGRLYSFLSITWGFIADVDIESERFRMIGNARFTLEAVMHIMKPKYYRAKLYYKPAPPAASKARSNTEVLINQVPSTDSSSQHMQGNSLSPSNDGFEEADFESADKNSSDGTSQSKLNSVDMSAIALPALEEPVPSDWMCIEADFITVVATYQSHIGPDLKVAPEATYDDGLIYLWILRAPMSRIQCFKIMTQIENGSHVTNPVSTLIPVTAFRLVPDGPDGHLVVDGERVPYGPVQATVLPGAARIMAL